MRPMEFQVLAWPLVEQRLSRILGTSVASGVLDTSVASGVPGTCMDYGFWYCMVSHRVVDFFQSYGLGHGDEGGNIIRETGWALKSVVGLWVVSYLGFQVLA